MTSMPATGRQAWRIRIPAHTIPRRSVTGVALDQDPYEVAAVDVISYEPTKRDALRFAVQDAQVDAGIPPWKPYLRITHSLAVSEEIVVSALTGTLDLS